jgi:hypothetical protein
MLFHHNEPIQVPAEFFATIQISFMKLFILPILIGMVLFASSSAWAYKVEKVCEDVPATSKAPAHKKCKVVRLNDKPPAKADGKSDPKADAKPDAKKAK